jgi:hypothetical protein
MRLKSPRRGWEEGATAVEAAIAFSLLFMLVFGIVEFGMALWQWNTLELAVLQAGRWVMINNLNNNLVANTEAQMQVVLPSASISCPLPSSPAAGNWYVCATQNGGTPATMSLSASYGYNVIGLAGPFQVIAQATVPLD